MYWYMCTCGDWISIDHGQLRFYELGSMIPGRVDPKRGWHIERTYAAFYWHFRWEVTERGLLRIAIPLWAFAVGPVAATSAAWRLDTLARRRARLNHCPTCNYSRADLPAASPCPECGKRPSRPEHADTQARTPMS
jgi:ssDNA-binding Zn-finger/Zn-ribbon topoisomerase 1